jgi:hypothetical protein
MRHLVTLAVVSTLALGTIASAQTQRRSRGAETAGPRDEVICRRFVRTGSLADFYRVCKTRGEWDRERMNIHNGTMNRNSCQTEGVGGHAGPGGYGGQLACGI